MTPVSRGRRPRCMSFLVTSGTRFLVSTGEPEPCPTRSTSSTIVMTTETHRSRQIRAQYTIDSLVVYQAFSQDIAEAAIQAQTFISPFSLSRMTWIKPSFLWMMYRSGWGSAQGQERVLAVEITRDGFEWALSHSCLSH